MAKYKVASTDSQCVQISPLCKSFIWHISQVSVGSVSCAHVLYILDLYHIYLTASTQLPVSCDDVLSRLSPHNLVITSRSLSLVRVSPNTTGAAHNWATDTVIGIEHQYRSVLL